MRIHRLDLVDFRNYQALSLSPPAGASVFVGANGAGKTNVLEAVHLVLTGFSHRAGRDVEMVRHGQEAFSVRATIERDALPGDLLDYQVLFVGRRKTVRRGRQVLTGKLRTAAMGAAVAFSPDDLEMVKGSPGSRRLFLDGVGSKAAPAYRTAVRRYESAVAQRNRLLAGWTGTPPEEEQLAAWTEQVVSCGSIVLAYRLRCMNRLVPLVAGFYRELAGASEPISITYRQAHGAAFRMPTGEGEFEAPDPADLALAVARALAATRQQERFRGVTLAGPHRDDIELTIGGQDSRLYASQGQQRSMALALRLAESELLRAVLDERPVLLLDDVFSELDQRRRDALLALLGLEQGGRQTFITATDLSGIPLRELGVAAEFQVRDGEVRRLA